MLMFIVDKGEVDYSVDDTMISLLWHLTLRSLKSGMHLH